MKRTKTIILGLCLVMLAQISYAQNAVKLENEMDSASYALGVILANQLKQQGVDSLNYDAVVKAMVDYFEEADSLKLQMDQCKQIYTNYVGKIAADPGINFLKENAKEKGVVTTPSGLQYKVLVQGDGLLPKATDMVIAHYTGKLIDGKIFDSSVERGEPLTIGANQVIRGWSEALQMMPVGSKWELYIPYQLGYGERGQGSIPPYATLIFEVELLGIQPAQPDAPAHDH